MHSVILMGASNRSFSGLLFRPTVVLLGNAIHNPAQSFKLAANRLSPFDLFEFEEKGKQPPAWLAFSHSGYPFLHSGHLRAYGFQTVPTVRQASSSRKQSIVLYLNSSVSTFVPCRNNGSFALSSVPSAQLIASQIPSQSTHRSYQFT